MDQFEEDKDVNGQMVPEAENQKKTSTRRNEKICNVKDHFPPLEVPKEWIRVVKGTDDWETVAETFLKAVYSTKVMGYHSIYQLNSSDDKLPHPTSILQLSAVGGPILIFQLTKLPNIPLALKRILAEPGILKVGVNVYNLARRLEKHHDVVVAGTLDLRALCEKVDQPDRIFMSLPDLSKAFLKEDLCITTSSSKSISARVSFWHRDQLRPDQIHYAAVFAHAALRIFINMVNLKICSFKTTIEDTSDCTGAWSEAQELWQDILNQDRKFTAFYCEICDVNPGMQQSFDGHLAGAKHKKSVAKLSRIEQFGEQADSVNYHPGSKAQTDGQASDSFKEMIYDPALWCKVCKVGMPGAEAMKQHMVGQKHRKKVKQKMDAGEEVEGGNPLLLDEDPDSVVTTEKQEFTCEVCSLTVPTEASMEFHLKGKKHKRLVSRKEALAGMESLGEEAGEVTEANADNMKRYCEACEVMVHNNQSWLMHVAGRAHKKKAERLDQLEVQVNCNTEFGAKRPAIDDLSGSVYCGICNTTVMASRENLDSHFQGKKHQTGLREKTALEGKAGTGAPSEALNMSPRMVDIAKAVVGSVSAEDVGNHESGIYCKVCLTFICGGKDALQSHLRGKKHLKNQLVIGKHKQPFKFPKARPAPYTRPRPRPPWQNSDINDIHEIPGVPAVDFRSPDSGGGVTPTGGFNHNRNFSAHHRGGFVGGTHGGGTHGGTRGTHGGSTHGSTHGGIHGDCTHGSGTHGSTHGGGTLGGTHSMGGAPRGRGTSQRRGQCPRIQFQGSGWTSAPNQIIPNTNTSGSSFCAQRQSNFGPSQGVQNNKVADLNTKSGQTDKTAVLTELGESLAGPSGSSHGSRGGTRSRGRVPCNNTERYHPYTLF